MVPSRRRARWRRRLGTGVVPALGAAAVLTLIIAFVAGALSQVSGVSGPYRRTIDRSWAALATSVASQSTTTGEAWVSLLGLAPTLDRRTFFTSLDRLASDAAAQQRALDAAVPPAPVGAADVGCEQALAGRASAVSSVRAGLEGVLGGRTGDAPVAPATAIEDLSIALSALEAADASWAACRRAVHRAPGTPALPASTWVANPASWPPTELAAIVDVVTGSSSLAARHGLAVLTTATDPASLPSGGTAVVPATTSFKLHVVVSNQGNVDEAAVEVRAGLTGGAGGPGSQAVAIVALKAGRSVSVVLGPLVVVPGSSYTLQVTASPPSGPGAAAASIGLQVETVPTTTTTVPPTTTTTAPRRSGRPSGGGG